MSRRTLVAAGAFLAVFAVLLAPWMRAAPHSYPAGSPFGIADEGLAAWVIAYVARTLTTAPASLFDAPLFHPAPGQLGRAEHLASSALLFGPLYLLTGNAVLATNAAVLCSYPLAAFFLWALLVRLGVGPWPAAAGALAYALGVLRVPGSLYLAKLPSWVVPLVALLVTRLREAPTLRRALALVAGLVFAALTSYYMALIAGIATALWAAAELLRSTPGRGRFAALSLGAGTASLALVAAVSLPYLRQPEFTDRAVRSLGGGAELLGVVHAATAGPLLMTLPWLGLAALAARAPVGRAARRGLVIALLAQSMIYGPAITLFGHRLSTPYAWLEASPLGFFRYPYLFSVLGGFGESLLIAAGVEIIARLLPVRARAVPAALVVVAILLARGPGLWTHGFVRSEGETHPIYAAVADAARRDGAGPLLQLPLSQSGRLPFWESEMVGNTRHWLPLVGGVAGYPPAHNPTLEKMVLRLPDPGALDDLVSMTRVRWLLLRPAPDWGLRKAQRRAITAMPGLERVAEAGGWDLFRVRARPSHPEWFDRIAAGPQQGRTVLGTPAIPLDPGATRGALRVPRDAASAQPGAGLRLRPTAVNLGGTAWPVATWETDAAKISLRTTLRSSDSPAAEETVALYDLPRDLFPGEAMSFEVWTKAPREPGGYTLDLDLVQGGTAPLPLVGPRARLAVTVEPEAPQTERSPSRPAAP